MSRIRLYLRSYVTGLVVVLGLIIVGFSAHPASAATASGNGFRISPPLYELTIPAGTSQTVSIFVENLANSTVTAHAIVNDFVAGNQENGDPSLILDPSKSAPTNSFKPLVQPIPDTQVAALDRQEIKVTLSVPAHETPGGYYGAIRFTALSSNGGSGNVALTASVGTLFLITVPGNLTENVQLASFDASHNGKNGTLFNGGPITLVTRLHNVGNIHVQPFGNIVIKNTFGKIVATTELNNTDPRGNILPNSIRKFENPVGLKHMFGRYTAVGYFSYGTSGKIVAAKKVFYVIPYVLIITLLLVILFLIFGLPRLIRWYNRRVIEKANRHNQPPTPPAVPPSVTHHPDGHQQP